MSLTPMELIEVAVKALDDKHGIDISVIDVTDRTTIGDYFIVASGSSNAQAKALAEEVEMKMTKLGYEPKNVEGYQTAMWILLDYGDIIIHIFYNETREFYSLEQLWNEAPRIDISNMVAKKESTEE